MNHKHNIGIYSCIWIVAILILFVSLFQNFGDAKVINYSGVIRGATQKLVKKEMHGDKDDELITYLDDVLFDLRTGEGKFDLEKINDDSYQQQLADMNLLWENIKVEIQNVRNGKSQDRLYSLSEEYFVKADAMVGTAQYLSDEKLQFSIEIFAGYLLVTISVFFLWYRYKQRQIDKAMYTDELTGIYNFNAFEMDVVKKNEVFKNFDYALICFDIDDFKYLNQTYGYQFGDQLLKIIATSLQQFVGGTGSCARYGSDQFFLYTRDAPHIIDDLRKTLKNNVMNAIELDVYNDLTLSFGVYKVDKNDSPQTMIDNASLAHKSAKKAGKGIVTYYNQDLLDKFYNESKMIRDMHLALTNKEFMLYLQPQFEMPNLNVIGAEALVRWHKSDGAILFPDEFIPIFEQNGFIYDLDFYMLEQVCQFLNNYHLEDASFKISINFSRVTIHHKDFYNRLTKTIKDYHVPIKCLALEITESAFNEFSSYTMSILNRLHNEGYVLSMDDFGTGYSSLNSIHLLPIDILKIDKEFLHEKTRTENMVSIIKLIIEIAHVLGMKVISEGVETQNDVDLLCKLDCHIGQGYYVSKAIIKEDFADKFLK